MSRLVLGAMIALLALVLLGGPRMKAARAAANEPLRQNLVGMLAQADRLETLSRSTDDFSASECYLHSLLSLAEDLRSSPAEWTPRPDLALPPDRLFCARERASHLCRTPEERRRLNELQNRFDDAVAYLAGA